MKYHRALLTFSIPFLIIIGGVTLYLQQEKEDQPLVSITPGTMKITSTAFRHNESVPSQYTCDADDISPPLQLSEAPEGTQSLALIVDDPDAPGKTWVHWLVWNMPADTTTLEEGATPPGTEGTTDFGKTGWGGPCPPSGTHRYFFKLYALDTELDLDPSATKAELEDAMRDHVLDQAELIGLYQKQS